MFISTSADIDVRQVQHTKRHEYHLNVKRQSEASLLELLKGY